MKALNIYTYTRIQEDMATKFDNILSQRPKKINVKLQEFNAIKMLVDLLLNAGANIQDFENFFTSYTIEQIGKEFDLLKIDQNNLVLNIELKSDDVGIDAIQKQLVKNQYYLKHIADEIRLYTFISSSKKLYRYTGTELKRVDIEDLRDTMQLFKRSLEQNIETLFKTENFLISPLNTPSKFISGDYFLTNQQQEIKEKIMDLILTNKKECILGITGKAGTGKTLLLYDIVKDMSEKGIKCCLVHSGILCNGHKSLNKQWDNVDIVSAKELNGEKGKILNQYRYIFVDESQRIYEETLKKIINEVISRSKVAVFAYDYAQSLSRAEEMRNIPNKLQDIDGFIEYKLSDKIRTSKEIVSFTRTMMNLNDRASGYMDYSKIDVLFSNSPEEAHEIIDLYSKNGYTFISYTQSLYYSNSIDLYTSSYDTHHVIGQEFDKVMIMMDENFRYDNERRIQGKEHPNPDLLFYKLLYQAISRARENLCILIVENYELFCNILEIKFEMLSRYQYKEKHTNISFSVRKLNRMTRKIKDTLVNISGEDSITISETIDMINDELMEEKLKNKVIRNGLKLLTILKEKVKNEDISKLILEYYNYIETVVFSCKK